MIGMRLALFSGRSIAATLMLALAACSGGGNSSAQAPSVSAAAATQDAAPSPELTSTQSAQYSGGQVLFSAANYSVAQFSGWAHLTLNRLGPFTEAIEVNYSTITGTAVAGTDFESTSGVVKWAENDSTPKVIAVPIYHINNPFSGTKAFEVVIKEPDAFAHIAGPATATVTITGDVGAAIGDVELSSPSYAVGQSDGSVTVTVNRIGGFSGSASVAYETASGTAVSGTNFTATSGTLDWADGDAYSKSFTVPISNATPFSGTKTFGIVLSHPIGGVSVASPANATVTITGDATAGAATAATGTLQLSAGSYPISQVAGKVTVTVKRMGGSNGAASVKYSTTSQTALSSKNFTATSGTLNWASGDATAKTFSVAISDETPFSGNKYFAVGLTNPSNGATISHPGSATVTIAGDAEEPVGILEYSAASYSVAQSAGTVTVTVKRAGGSSGAVSVAYTTTSGTAVSSKDYTTASGTLDWASGDSSWKSFSVPVSNAEPFAGHKSFTVSLSKPTGGATLGSPTSASVVIAGDAVAAVGSLQLTASSYTVAESAGSLTVTVNRTGGSSGAVSVAYATANGTAVAGTNFTATSGALDWANGDASSKSFTVAINKSAALSGSEAFKVALSSPSGGATLSTPSSAAVTIEGDSGTTAPRGSVPTNLQVIRQGQNLNTATNNGSSCTVQGKGDTSVFEPNYDYIGWHSVPGATSYNIYRATNGGTLSLYDTLTASAATTNYSTYVTGLTNVGNTYYAAPGIDSAYFDTKATAVIGNDGASGVDFTAAANVTSGSTSIKITSISSGKVAVGQGIGDTNGNIPIGATLVSGPGGTGTYTMSQAATGSATGETVGAVLTGNQGYTYKVTAVASGVESAQSAFAYIPFIVNGGFQTSSGAFDSCVVADQTAPSTTPLGWSLAAAWWPVEPASGPVTNPAPLPNCNGYPQFMNTYSGWAAPSYHLSITGYKYLNLSVWTAQSGAQLTGDPEICGDAGLSPITSAQMANYGPATLNQNAWSTYKIPVSVAYSNKNGVAQTALYKITWGIGGTPSTTKPVYIEYWFSVD
jgi:hypothetical protein